MASDRMRKKIKDYAEIFGHIMRKHALIMRKLHRIMRKFKQVIKLIIRPVQCIYMQAYGKSVIEIATNTIAFVTEFLPLGVTNLRPAFTVEIKGLAVGILPQLLVK